MKISQENFHHTTPQQPAPPRFASPASHESYSTVHTKTHSGSLEIRWKSSLVAAPHRTARQHSLCDHLNLYFNFNFFFLQSFCWWKLSLFSSLTLKLLRSKDFKETFFFKKEYSDAFEAFKMAAREFNWRRSLLGRFLACPGLLWLSRPNGLGQLSSGQDVAGGHSNMLIIFLFSVFCNFSCLLNFIFSLFIYMLLQFQHSRINTKLKP